MNPAGLYIHIPFCRSKCPYCDFVSIAGQSDDVIAIYLKALDSEMANYSGYSVRTIFIGGGTPTVLSSKQLSRLFKSITTVFKVDSDAEITVEANPESSTREKLQLLYDNGVNRLSFGAQSANNIRLEWLGRCHKSEDFLLAYASARSIGFKNINTDLIYGIPGQTFEEWVVTVKTVLSLAPEHISAYPLTIEENTPFYNNGIQVEEDFQAELYTKTAEILPSNGYEHYEISNFARESYQCRHNLIYWRNEDYIGIGLGACGYINGTRWQNIKDMQQYIEYMNVNKIVIPECHSPFVIPECLNRESSSSSSKLPRTYSESLAGRQKLAEKLMLALRLKEGAGLDLAKHFWSQLKEFAACGWLEVSDDKIALTSKGWLFSNQIFRALL